MSLLMDLASFSLKLKINYFNYKNLDVVKNYRVANRRPAADIPFSLSSFCNIDTTKIDGREVIHLKPKNKSSNKTLIYLHGGAYVSDIIKLHWWLIEYLIRKSGVNMVIPLYHLAPQASIKTEMPFLERIYLNLAENFSGDIFFAGDSAGGGLCLALAINLREKALSMPKEMFLFSPWLDIKLNNEYIKNSEDRDNILGVKVLQWCGRLWADDVDLNNSLLSPINDDLHNLPPINIYQGTDDILFADVIKFSKKAEKIDTICNTHIYNGAFHVFVALPLLFEARQALNDVSRLINNPTNHKN